MVGRHDKCVDDTSGELADWVGEGTWSACLVIIDDDDDGDISCETETGSLHERVLPR